MNPTPLPATNGVFRTQLIRELGDYDESDSVSGSDYLFADCDLYRRLQAAGYDSVYEPSASAEMSALGWRGKHPHHLRRLAASIMPVLR